MNTVISQDGTPIAFDRSGAGAPLILVVGAFNERATGRPLAAALTDHFTVFNYDRRGRGASGDTLPYAVEREIDDLAALLGEAGGSAAVFGYSSGAILALLAAAQGLPITKLALYDPPFFADAASARRFQDLVGQLGTLLAADQRGAAVELFQTQAVGIPPAVVAQLRQAPFWPALEAGAPTLVYEATLLAVMPDLAARLAAIPAATLVLNGGEMQGAMLQAGQAVAAALPHAEYRALAGQTHDLNPAVLAPILEAFFTG